MTAWMVENWELIGAGWAILIILIIVFVRGGTRND